MNSIQDVQGQITGHVTCRILEHRRALISRRHELLFEDPDGYKHWVAAGDTITLNFRLDVRSVT